MNTNRDENDEKSVESTQRQPYAAPDIDSLGRELMDKQLGTDTCTTSLEAGELSDCNLH